ncbi:MAG TPA: hypothetical protein VGF67_19375 [Ktedonobacteraceae bacterium]|jgi:DNA-binding helix-hairpin-helix protein with protein kinase domain
MHRSLNLSGLRRENGAQFKPGERLSAGGEGTIYRVVGEPGLVAKLYHAYSPEREAKLARMLASPPGDPARRQGHISIAWPTERLFDRAGRCVGFLMPFIDTTLCYPLLRLYNPKDRRDVLPGFTWRYLVRVARNLASVLRVLHRKGYVVGDLNESNILVTSTALVTLVDCDSMQVSNGERIFRCPVGKAEFTPPELQQRNFSTLDRQPVHDNFGLAVLIFLLLMEGRHPFTGVWRGGEPVPTLEQNIAARNFPYAGHTLLSPPRYALPLSILPPALQRLVRRSMRSRGRRRPTARQWSHALHRLEQRLEVCPVNPQHIYSMHLQACPWCQRTRLGVADPFPATGRLVRSDVGRAARRRRRQVIWRRVSNGVFGLLIPALFFYLEAMFWTTHRPMVEQWLAASQSLERVLFFFLALGLPFLLALLLRRLLRAFSA